MANWYQDQLTNKNFLSPIGFVFLLEKARKTSFLCQKAEIFKIANRNPRIPTGQYKGFNDYRYSDATLQVLNNNNLVNFDVVFKNVFPVSLSTMPFDVTGTDNDYLTATATFEYVLYEVREKNQQKLR